MNTEKQITGRIDKRIDLMIAQSAPSVNIVGLSIWQDADFEHLKREIKILIHQEKQEMIEKFKEIIGEDEDDFSGLGNPNCQEDYEEVRNRFRNQLRTKLEEMK